jgi:two-component system response regulator DevR
VGDAGTVVGAFAGIPTAKADVAVLDVRLKDGSGIELCERLKKLKLPTKYLMLSSFIDDDLIAHAARAGASGYLLKELHGPEIILAVKRLARGEQVFGKEQVETIQNHSYGSRSPAERYASLSPKEREVLAKVGTGLTNRQIGDEMGLAEKTVKNYMSSVMSKLGVTRRTQAAVMVTQRVFDLPQQARQGTRHPTQ